MVSIRMARCSSPRPATVNAVSYTHLDVYKRQALTAFGFDRVVEVALGADVITIKEAEEYIRRRQRGDLFMITSCCCPPFIRLVQKFRPLLAHLISDSVSPMIAIGRLLKAENPKLKVVFIGPCIAKKSEARQPELAGAVDFVLTFEETDVYKRQLLATMLFPTIQAKK